LGAVDEAGKAATGFIAVLSHQPLSLALVVMNLALLCLVFYTANEQATNRRYMAEQVLSQLSKCIDADEMKRIIETLGRRSDFKEPG